MKKRPIRMKKRCSQQQETYTEVLTKRPKWRYGQGPETYTNTKRDSLFCAMTVWLQRFFVGIFSICIGLVSLYIGLF